jgi:hypothetical protein
MEQQRLRTLDLDEEPARYPEQSLALPPTNQLIRRWVGSIGVVAALLIVALAATLFASHTSRRSTPGPGGSTPGPANVHPGPPLPEGVTMTNVTLAGLGEYWAVGDVINSATGQPDKTVILRFSNGKWSQVGDAPMSGRLNGIEMVSATEGWAWGADFNNANIILHINSGSWQRVTLSSVNPQATPQFISMRSATDGWLVMANPKTADGATTPSSLFHYANGAWNPVQSPLLAFWDIAAVGPGEAWMLGGEGESQAIVHVTLGRAVVALRLPVTYNAGDIGLARLRALAPNDVWATGMRYSAAPATSLNWLVSSTPVVYHYNGASWQTIDTHAPAGAQWIEVVSASDMWATRSIMTFDFPGQRTPTRRQIQALYHFRNGAWREVPLPYGDLSDFVISADASTATDIWAEGAYPFVNTPSDPNSTTRSGGTYPVLLHYLNDEWTEYGR